MDGWVDRQTDGWIHQPMHGQTRLKSCENASKNEAETDLIMDATLLR